MTGIDEIRRIKKPAGIILRVLGQSCFLRGLLARADSASQAAVINAIGGVPQRLTKLHALAKHFNFVRASCGCIGWFKTVLLIRDKVLIVTVAKNCLEDVLASTHVNSVQILWLSASPPRGHSKFYVG